MKSWDTPSSPQGARHPSGRGEFRRRDHFEEFRAQDLLALNFRELPKNFKLLDRAKKLRKAGYFHEVKLWEKLKGRQMCGLDFHRQQVIGNYIVDFVCYEKWLIIEADGASHKNKREYDENRDNYLKNIGFSILHIPVKEIFKNLNNVVNKIKGKIEEIS